MFAFGGLVLHFQMHDKSWFLVHCLSEHQILPIQDRQFTVMTCSLILSCNCIHKLPTRFIISVVFTWCKSIPSLFITKLRKFFKAISSLGVKWTVFIIIHKQVFFLWYIVFGSWVLDLDFHLHSSLLVLSKDVSCCGECLGHLSYSH